MTTKVSITEFNGWWTKTVLYTNADNTKGFYVDYKETPTSPIVETPHVGHRPDDRG